MADEKTTKVTFTANVDHYVKGDTIELTADELKRVDDYAKRWNIEKPYVKGEKDVETDEAEDALPSRTTTVTSADGSRRAATTSNRSNATTDAVTDQPVAPNESAPLNNTSSRQPIGDADAAAEGQGSSDTTTAPSTSDSAAGDSQDSAEGNQPATELPPVSDKPVTGQGKTPKTATKKPASK